MKTEKEKFSYVIGQQIAGDFTRQDIDIDPEIFTKSFISAYAGEESELSPQQMQEVMMNFQKEMQKKQQEKQGADAQKNLAEGEAFLEENKSKEGVIETESGLQYRVKESGNGKTPAATDTVVTHYEGRTIDGKVFDSSIKRGQPATFPVNGVIKGWTEALQLMKEGDKLELFIPAGLAYGAAGAGGTIGPNATLIFDIELIEVK